MVARVGTRPTPPQIHMSEKPTNITVNKKTREFSITWDDAHLSVYPFGLLRAACPCAQ